MVQTPILPTWLPKALAALIALAVVAVVLWLTVLNPAIKSTATTAANNALSAAGIKPGGGGGGGGGSPTPTPSSSTVTPPPGSAGGARQADVSRSARVPAIPPHAPATAQVSSPLLPATRSRSPTSCSRTPTATRASSPSSRGCGKERALPGAAQQLPRPRLPLREPDHVLRSGRTWSCRSQCTAPARRRPSPPRRSRARTRMVWSGSLKPNS